MILILILLLDCHIPLETKRHQYSLISEVFYHLPVWQKITSWISEVDQWVLCENRQHFCCNFSLWSKFIFQSEIAPTMFRILSHKPHFHSAIYLASKEISWATVEPEQEKASFSPFSISSKVWNKRKDAKSSDAVWESVCFLLPAGAERFRTHIVYWVSQEQDLPTD